jgi:hypothetical protein
MEDAYEKDIANEWGPANAVTTFQIRAMFKMAKLKQNDVFCDVGSGHGRVVRLAVKVGHVKKAIGIEHGPDRFCHARMLAKRLLTKGELAKVDFWFNEVDDLKPSWLSDVTVVYYGLDTHKDSIKMFKRLFGSRKVHIILKDLPLVGYSPVATSRESSTTWFFLMTYPFKHRIKDRDEWAKSFLDPKATINDVFRYYDRQLKKRDLLDRKESVRALKKQVNATFTK